MTFDQYVAWLVWADDDDALAAYLALFKDAAVLECFDDEGRDGERIAATSPSGIRAAVSDDRLWFVRGPRTKPLTDGGHIWSFDKFFGFQLTIETVDADDYGALTPEELRSLAEADRRLRELIEVVVDRINPLVACTCAYVDLVGDGPHEFADHVAKYAGNPSVGSQEPFRWYANRRWYDIADSRGIDFVRGLGPRKKFEPVG